MADLPLEMVWAIFDAGLDDQCSLHDIRQIQEQTQFVIMLRYLSREWRRKIDRRARYFRVSFWNLDLPHDSPQEEIDDIVLIGLHCSMEPTEQY